MTHVELVGGLAHVYVRGRAGHRPSHDCPCRPSTPLETYRGPELSSPTAKLYVHRPIDERTAL